MKWYLTAFRNFAHFSGRANRYEYWLFVLFNSFFSVIAIVLDLILKTSFTVGYDTSLMLGWIYATYSLVVFVPSLSLTIRRLHDMGKSAWYLLIPIFSVIIFYVFIMIGAKTASVFHPKALYHWGIPGLIFLLSGMILFSVILLLKGDTITNKYGDAALSLSNDEREKISDTLILLLFIAEASTRIISYLWTLSGKSLSHLAEKDFKGYQRLQELLAMTEFLLGSFELLSLAYIVFLVKNKRKRIILLIIAGVLFVLQNYYAYSIMMNMVFGIHL